MRSAILLVGALACLAAAGCERTREVAGRGGFVADGIRYKGRVSKSKENPYDFSVTVRRAERNPAAGAEAARMAGAQHCIKYVGRSDVTWRGQGPETEALALDQNGALTMRGSCKPW